MQYRKEIDGLRAFAVLPVIFFHAGFHTFSGGFVGVDVFFVISGYLITSILTAELKQDRFSIIQFYERRARRILPALFVVMLCSLIAAWFTLLPDDMQHFSKSLVAVPLFVSNLLFWLTSGYFDTTAELRPLLHTWSLAVEEQYYVFFPLLLCLLWKQCRARLGLILAGLALVSLLLADWGSHAKPMASFYLLPTRGWELLFGALASLYLSEPRRALSPACQQALSALGMLMLLTAIFVYDKQTPFPGRYALLPTVAATLLILFATPHTWTGKLLSQRVFVGVGLISYSAYLWHQPLFALVKYRSAAMPASTTMGGLIVLTLLLASLSWKYIEAPFRDKQRIPRSTVFAASLLGAALFIAIGVAGNLSEGFALRAPVLRELVSIPTVEKSRCHTYGRKTTTQIAQGDICTEGANAPVTAALIGDSHAGALTDALAQVASKQGVAFYSVTGSFCVPLLDLKLSAYQAPDCVGSIRAVYQRILQNPDISHVILVAEWANYIAGDRDDGNGSQHQPVLISTPQLQAKTPADNQRVFAQALQASVATLQAAGKTVIIVKPVPEFKVRVSDVVYKQRWYGWPQVTPTVSRAEYQARNADVLHSFDTLSQVTFIDPTQALCDEMRCAGVDAQGQPRYSDSNHLNFIGATPIAEALRPFLLKQTKLAAK